jgi:hypothetical protein
MRLTGLPGPSNVQQSIKLCDCGCGLPTTVSKVNCRTTGQIKGQGRRFRLGHYARTKGRKGYESKLFKGKSYNVHRMRAEIALGKPLPAGSEVHHADGSMASDAPLVICQDEAYHKLLHVRMRVVRAGGNPNTDKICQTCRSPKQFSQFHKWKSGTHGLYHSCKFCACAASAVARERKRAASCA